MGIFFFFLHWKSIILSFQLSLFWFHSVFERKLCNIKETIEEMVEETIEKTIEEAIEEDN